jgi:pimeloyl-ACP methyl ester carboxylesterase
LIVDIEAGMGFLDEETSRFTASTDGLRLHYRDLGPASSAALPVLCLPGLTRTSEDFGVLAAALAAGQGGLGAGVPRRVLALDYRGRGGSARDPQAENYNVGVEAGDVLAVLAAARVGPAIFVGTSRGGLITLVLGATHPGLIRGTVLNDIGPVLEPAGLERIRGYVGKLPIPRNWDEAVGTIQGYAGSQFTGLSKDEWLAFARTTFVEREGTFHGRYDPALMHALRALEPTALPALWPQFEGLARAPLLVIRGENSDLLSETTAAEMARRHPDCALFTVPGQGHAPLLRDAATLDRIAAFARHCDRFNRAGSDADTRPIADAARSVPESGPA